MRTLSKGARGPDVRTLQAYLNLIQDGIFGVLTEEAVKAFQVKNGLKADGTVGPLTWEKITATETIKKSKRKIDLLIVHCTATPEGKNFTTSDIKRWHTTPKPNGRGWSDIGYHYVIYLDGSIHNGRDVDLIGAHVTDHNYNSIGIVYIGGTDKNGKAKDTRTEVQKQSLIKLLKELKEKYPKATIHGHNEFANKACPCFDVKAEYKKI